MDDKNESSMGHLGENLPPDEGIQVQRTKVGVLEDLKEGGVRVNRRDEVQSYLGPDHESHGHGFCVFLP